MVLRDRLLHILHSRLFWLFNLVIRKFYYYLGNSCVLIVLLNPELLHKKTICAAFKTHQQYHKKQKKIIFFLNFCAGGLVSYKGIGTLVQLSKKQMESKTTLMILINYKCKNLHTQKHEIAWGIIALVTQGKKWTLTWCNRWTLIKSTWGTNSRRNTNLQSLN